MHVPIKEHVFHGSEMTKKKLASCSAKKVFSAGQPRPEKFLPSLLTMGWFPLEPRIHFPETFLEAGGQLKVFMAISSPSKLTPLGGPVAGRD